MLEGIQNEKFRLQQVIDGTDAGTWEWNVQTGETIYNEKWAQIIGYTLEELDPVSIDTWMKYAHPDDFAASNQNLQDCFERRSEQYECACRMEHKSGEWVWVMDRGKVMSWTEDGKPEWMIGSHINITSMKRLEESLEMERKKFTTIFNSTLQFIGFLDLDETAQKYIHFAADRAIRMNSLIDDLLAFAEIGGAKEEAFEKVDMNDVFDETFLLKAALIDEKKALVSKTTLPVVWANKTAMRLLFQNLIGNGLKYQPEGNRPIIEIDCSETNNSYTFRFKDNGIGISEENYKKVFNLFSRLHANSEYVGTGMGLATCKKIVASHKGDIWLESTLGKGSTFYFTLPKT